MALLIRVLLAAALLVAAVSAAPQLTAAHPGVPSDLGHISFSKAQDNSSATVVPGEEAHATQNDEDTDEAQTEQPQPISPIHSFGNPTRFTRNAQNQEESEEDHTEQPQPAGPIPSFGHPTRFTRKAQHQDESEEDHTELPQPAGPISSFGHPTRYTRGAQYEEGHDDTFSEEPSAPAFGTDGFDNQDAFSNPPTGSDPDSFSSPSFGSDQGSSGPYDAQPFGQDSPYDPSQGQF